MRKSLVHIEILACFFFVGVVHAETKTVAFTFPEPIPKSITISQGDSIRFEGVSISHPIKQVTSATGDTPVSGGFESQTGPFTVMFDNPGTFYYLCENHGTNGGTMRGEVVVQEGANPNPTPQPTADPDATPVATVAPPSGCTAKPSPVTLTSPASGSDVNKTRVTLDWEDESCASNYKVLVRSGKKKGPVADQKTVTKSTYKTKKLARDSTYYWSVKSCNSLGCSNSASRSFSN